MKIPTEEIKQGLAGIQIEPPKNKIDRGVSLCIYADPGVGKTTLASTLPPDDTLIVNTEANLGPFLGKQHSIFNLKDDLSQIEVLYQALHKNPVKYLVLDNVSEMEQWMINTLTKSRKKDFVELKEYGDSAYKMREYLRLFRDLVYKGTTVVFNAWEMSMDIQVTGGEVRTKAFPKLGKKLSVELCGLVDIVGHLEIYPKTGDRYIRFEGTKEICAKSQFKGLEKFEQASLPEVLQKIYDYDYTKEEA